MAFQANTGADSPLKSGKKHIVGAVEMIDHVTGKPNKPEGHGANYLYTLSGRIRLAAMPSNEAGHILAFIKANISPGASLLNASAMRFLTLLGEAGDALGMDRQLKVNSVKRRLHSLSRRGRMLYDLVPAMPDPRLRSLIETFLKMPRNRPITAHMSNIV